MATFINPRGTLIPHPEDFGLLPGARIIFGTSGDDNFIFTEAANDKVVVGMGGNDTFNAAAVPVEWDTRYYSFLDEEHFDLLAPKGLKWEPWKSGKDIAHIGGNMDAKLGLGADTVVLHGGHYQSPAQVWLQHNDTLVIADDKGLDITNFKTVGKAQRDSDGHGMTTQVKQVYFEAHSANPIADGQKFGMMFADQGAYVDRAGNNLWRPTYIDHDGPKLTVADIEHFLEQDRYWGDVLV